MWISIIECIMELYVNENHSILICNYEDLLCAALESKHKSMVNSAIDFWNSTFGQSTQELTYPERLQNTLLQLRPVADIQLPSLSASLLSDAINNDRQQPEFEETQFDFGSTVDMSDFSSALNSRLPPSPLRNIHGSSPMSGAKSLKRSLESTPEGIQRKSRKRDTTPRLRHDDSQIQFQPIESSPSADRVMDSQMLTDRQKEVRERQLTDGMFQNIGSSPSRRHGSANESDQELPVHRSSSQSSLLRARPREGTPVLVTPSDEVEEFITSSPTPTRSIKSGVDEDEPGSSPPQVPVDMELDDVPSSPIEYIETQDMEGVTADEPGQLDHNAAAPTPAAISTYGTTIDFNEAVIEQQISVAELQELVDEHVEAAHPPLKNEVQLAIPIEIDDNAFDDSDSSPDPIERPSTPTQQINDDQIPGSPPSPDVFVDAVSSPPRHIEESIQPISSEVDEFDESSIIRVLAEADKNRAVTPRSTFKIPDSRPSSSKSTPQVVIPKTLPRRFEAVGETPVPKKTRGHRLSALFTTPFHIPETPAHGPTALELSRDILVTDPSLTPDNTIIFNNPELWEEEDEISPDVQGKAKDVVRPGAGHKRKLVEIEDEVASSQASVREGSVVSTASSAKRGRGRPRKSDIDMVDATADSQQSQSTSQQSLLRSHWLIFSVSSQASSSSNKNIRGRPRKSPLPSQDVMDDDEHEVHAQLSQEIDMASFEIPETSSIEPTHASSGSAQKGATSQAAIGSSDGGVIVPETVHKEQTHQPIPMEENEETIDVFETSREDVYISNDHRAGSILAGAAESMIEETRLMSPTQGGKAPAATSPPLSIFGTVREQLQALMNTLRGGSLTRAETLSVEDDLMDVKEALYGASRRGRNRNVHEEVDSEERL